MRLSEAIRLGAAVTRQTYEQMHRHGRTCALGAAMFALGSKLHEIEGWDGIGGDTIIDLLRPLNAKGPVSCPSRQCCYFFGRYRNVIGEMIPHLNDTHRWKRERIADWVELHEPLADVTVPDEPGTQGDLIRANRNEPTA